MTLDPSKPSAVTGEDFIALLRESIPLAQTLPFEVDDMSYGRCVLRLPHSPLHLRAGGIISGPAMMTLADTVLYGAVLSCVGLVRMAVTTDMSIRFLRPAFPSELVGEGNILRIGKKLAVGEVSIFNADKKLIAHATGTYALPS